MTTRDHDIVLFGATGFVGRLTAAHLAEHAPEGTRIALAARSRDRLEAVRADLPARAADWPLLVVDAADPAQVAALAASTKAVATTVGPYVKYGGPLAAACAQAGTHYADLTGEILFVHDSIAANHETAQRTGARIVHACGFDSIPSDLGVLLTYAAARAEHAGPLGATRLAVRSLRGGYSGGTIDSMRTQVATVSGDPGAKKVIADPYALAEGGRPAQRGPSAPERTTTENGVLSSLSALGPVGATVGRLAGEIAKASPVRTDPGNGHFTAPFVMGQYNSRIVQRSASLLGYGPGFRYVEYQDTGAGASGALTAATLSAVLLGGLAALSFAPTRWVADRFLPKPGEGPSEEAMASGRFRMEITALAGPGAEGAWAAYRTTVGAPYDPGYTGTAVMLGQSALALAHDADLPDAAGVLTPAAGLGMPLVERLREHQFRFDTERLPS